MTARALIGLGVSACLMASFKAFSLWFPAERQPSLNAAVMAAGGLGALTATLPIGWALPIVGWRGVFFVLAGLAVLVAGAILTTPEKRVDGGTESLGEQLRAVGEILRSRVFWRFAPQTAAVLGGFMAVQGLWSVPWLMVVSGQTREVAAFHMFLTSSAMLTGFLAIALLVVPLRRRGLEPETILKAGMGCGLLLTGGLIADLGVTHLLWFGLGLVFSVGNLAYALFSANFPLRLAGRANTTLNLAAFAGAFALQWGFGALVDMLQANGLPPREAFRWTYGVLLVLQALAYAWFLLGGTQEKRQAKRP